LSICDQVDKDRTQVKLQELSDGIAQLIPALSRAMAEASGLQQETLGEWQTELMSIASEARADHEALRINPDDAEAHYNLAIALRDQQRFAEAKVEAEAALQLNPSNEQAERMIEELTEKGY